jgi:hypothetical protein
MPRMATGEDSTLRLATAALAPYATGNAVMGGPSSVEGVGEDLSNKFLRMAQGMPPDLRSRLAIQSGYRDQARQMQVNPSAPNSRHGAGTAPPRPAGNPQCGSVAARARIQALTMVTNTPPSDANACVMPNHFSFCARSVKTSAIQVIAATNSMHTPMNVQQR